MGEEKKQIESCNVLEAVTPSITAQRAGGQNPQYYACPAILFIYVVIFLLKQRLRRIKLLLYLKIAMEFTFHFCPTDPKPMCPVPYQLERSIASASTILTC